MQIWIPLCVTSCIAYRAWWRKSSLNMCDSSILCDTLLSCYLYTCTSPGDRLTAPQQLQKKSAATPLRHTSTPATPSSLTPQTERNIERQPVEMGGKEYTGSGVENAIREFSSRVTICLQYSFFGFLSHAFLAVCDGCWTFPQASSS